MNLKKTLAMLAAGSAGIGGVALTTIAPAGAWADNPVGPNAVTLVKDGKQSGMSAATNPDGVNMIVRDYIRLNRSRGFYGADSVDAYGETCVWGTNKGLNGGWFEITENYNFSKVGGSVGVSLGGGSGGLNFFGDTATKSIRLAINTDANGNFKSCAPHAKAVYDNPTSNTLGNTGRYRFTTNSAYITVVKGWGTGRTFKSNGVALETFGTSTWTMGVY